MASNPFSGQRMQFGPTLTPVVKKLIIINVAIYLFALFLRQGAPPHDSFNWIYRNFGLVSSDVVGSLKIWQLITYAFLHLTIGHVLWNMFALWMFGCELEGRWGRRSFFLFYLLCAVGGGLAVTIYELASGKASLTVGASGAGLGLVVAYGVLFANRTIQLLFPPIPIKAKWLALGFVILNLLYFLEGRQGVSIMAHLGGALTAFLYLKSGFRFSPSPRIVWGGLSLAAQFKRWRARRHLRVIVNDEEKDEEPRGPTFH